MRQTANLYNGILATKPGCYDILLLLCVMEAKGCARGIDRPMVCLTSFRFSFPFLRTILYSRKKHQFNKTTSSRKLDDNNSA